MLERTASRVRSSSPWVHGFAFTFAILSQEEIMSERMTEQREQLSALRGYL